MSIRPPVGWFHVATLSRLTVPPFLRNVVGADVELVAGRVPAVVGQRVEQQDPRVLAEAVAVVLGGGEAAGAGADDHAVVGLVAVDDAADVDAGAALGRVDVALVGRPVDAHDVADEVVAAGP